LNAVKHSQPAVAQLLKVQNCTCKNRSCKPYSTPLGVICHPYARTCYSQCLCQIWSS